MARRQSEQAVRIVDAAIPLDDLIPHPRNYNRHNESQVGRLAAAIQRIGFTAPIIVTPEKLVLGGHLRRLALLKIRDGGSPPPGIASDWTIPCRVVQCSEGDQLRILATDNPNPDTIDQDMGALADLLAEIQQEGGLEGTWYDDADAERMLLEAMQFDQAEVENGAAAIASKNGSAPHKPVVLRPVLLVEDVALIERAIHKTGCLNRAEAVMVIFREYLAEG